MNKIIPHLDASHFGMPARDVDRDGPKDKKGNPCWVAFLTNIPVSPLIVPEFFQCKYQIGQQNTF
jgi:hypothetical protein